MDQVETEFFEAEDMVKGMTEVYRIFFIWTESENKLESFLQRLNSFHPKLKFTHKGTKILVDF